MIAIIWSLNLFNFMDALTALRLSEALFISAAGAWLGLAGHDSRGSRLCINGSCRHFGVPYVELAPSEDIHGRCWQWLLRLHHRPYWALAAARENGVMIFVWLILGGVFLSTRR